MERMNIQWLVNQYKEVNSKIENMLCSSLQTLCPKKLAVFVIPETIIQICSENDCDDGRALQFSKKLLRHSWFLRNITIFLQHFSLHRASASTITKSILST